MYEAPLVIKTLLETEALAGQNTIDGSAMIDEYKGLDDQLLDMDPSNATNALALFELADAVYVPGSVY